MRGILSRTLLLGMLVCALSAAASYWIVSQGERSPADAAGSGADRSADAQSDGQRDHPGDYVTPEPGSTPDTRQEWWYVPYLNAERDESPFEGTINGITIQVQPVDIGRYRSCDEQQNRPLSDADDTPVGIPATLLPEGATIDGLPLSVWCDSRAVVAQATVNIPSNEEAGYLGGSVHVIRYEGPALASATIPEERWIEGEVNGHPAALASPILENGLGFSAIIVRHDNYVTRMVAENIPYSDLLELAEGIVR